MTTIIRCNGCHTEIDPQRVAITGTRTDGWCGVSPLPDGEFHWCETCGKTAFGALRFHRGRDTAPAKSPTT